ncbi:methylenetetrahydrofolate reductase [Lactobacillus sp. Sy-1]|uniref:methylenetetrahydrofolate reductase n=1 Tax=Lactobacillus sp. Sy-1 TaxID=2109645 RepID=UPI001C5B4480|nr:methylenetetrahydrofolate reductase [Lactobacillus sp. Sy-1]MBW1606024.1 methylenetetrahydrofolate reductase [Lactobacillus sp. Sy-1]
MSISSNINLTLELQVSSDENENQRNFDFLQKIQPLAVYVPFGAGGNQQQGDWLGFVDHIQNQLQIPVVPHLTGYYQTQAAILDQVEKLRLLNINQLLVLRGDAINGQQSSNEFPHASDLIQLIKSIAPEFKINGACYPEGHYEAPSLAVDIQNLKHKVSAGCDELVTQVEFDNTTIIEFFKRVRATGIRVPIRVGILPVLDRTRVQKLIQLTHVKVPQRLADIMEVEDPERFTTLGCQFTNDQLADLTSHGIDNIHLYSLNNPVVFQSLID